MSWFARHWAGSGVDPERTGRPQSDAVLGPEIGSGSTGARAVATHGEEAARASDVEMMGRALELARVAGEQGEVPVGAVVYRETPGGPEVLGEGRNTRERERDPAGHAEFLAIQKACQRLGDWRLEGCTLVVTLEPCPMCAGLILNSRVPRVVYGAADPKAGAVSSLFSLLSDSRLNHRCEVIAGVRGSESAALLTAFFRELRAKSKSAAGANPNKERV